MYALLLILPLVAAGGALVFYATLRGHEVDPTMPF